MGRKISVIAAVFFLSAVVFTFTACNFAGDSARVTINIGKPPELASRLPQKPGILDRIVSFFTLGTTAHADPSPEDWYEIRLNVTGEGMSPLEVEIPLDTGQITLTLPLGKKTFTVVVEGDGVRLYGAIKTLELGGATTINLQLGPLPNEPVIDHFSFADYGVNIYWTISEPLNVTGFKVYRSDVYEGTYVLIKIDVKSIFPYSEPYYSYNDVNGILETWYKITAYNQYGEGDFYIPDSYQNYW